MHRKKLKKIEMVEGKDPKNLKDPAKELFTAAETGNVTEIKKLLKSDTEFTNDNLSQALRRAINAIQYDAVLELLKNGIKPTYDDANYAAEYGTEYPKPEQKKIHGLVLLCYLKNCWEDEIEKKLDKDIKNIPSTYSKVGLFVQNAKDTFSKGRNLILGSTENTAALANALWENILAGANGEKFVNEHSKNMRNLDAVQIKLVYNLIYSDKEVEHQNTLRS